MSTKRFCDFCGQEIHPDHSHAGAVIGEHTLRKHREHRPYSVAVEINVRFKDDDGHPDMCARCVFAAVRSIDPTSREMEPSDAG